MRLFVGTVLQPPASLTASFGTAWDRVNLEWGDVPLALTYDIYFKRSEQGEEMYNLLATVDGDTNTFAHSRTAPVGKESSYNQVYDYRIQSRAGIETSPGFSTVASGGRYFSDVLSLSASDRSEVGGVRVEWEAAAQPGLEGISYEVRRAGELITTTSLTEVFVTSPLTPDSGVYEFWIVPQTPDGNGIESQHDFGSELCFDHYSLVPEQGACLGLAGAMIAGNPAFTLHETTGLRYMRANNSAPQAQTDWQASIVPLPEDVTVVGRLQLIDWQGRPLIIARVDDADTLDNDYRGVQLSLADVPNPQSDDWQSILLGYDPYIVGVPRAAVVGGRLSLAWVTESGGTYNAFYFRSAADPLDKLNYIADFVLPENNPTSFELDIAEIDGHPALLLAKQTHLSYMSTLEQDGASPEDWTGHDISNFLASYYSPRLLQWDQRICACMLNGSSPARGVATTLLTSAAAGLNPTAFDDWFSAGLFAPPGRKFISVELSMHPQSNPVSIRYGSDSGDDIGNPDDGQGLLYAPLVAVDDNVQFQSHYFRDLVLGLGEGALFIPTPPAPAVLEDLTIAQFEHGGDFAFALALNPEDDASGMEVRYFYVPPGTP
jgi:hypothetical protein